MKWNFWLLLVLLPVLAGVALAQDEAEIARARKALAQRRSAADALYTSERAACYQRFIVNACLEKSQRRHSDSLHDIRREEIVLNDLERKRNAVDETRKLEQRNSAQTREQSERDRLQRVQDMAEKQREHDARLRNKNGGSHDAKQPKAASTTTAPADKTRVAPSHDAAQARADFEQKQKDAAQHRAEADANRKARTKPLSPPLPPQGMAPTPLNPQLLEAPPPAKPASAP